MQYAAKNIIVNAFQWDGHRLDLAKHKWAMEAFGKGRLNRAGPQLMLGNGSGPDTMVYPNDWVVDLWGGGSLVVFPDKTFRALFDQADIPPLASLAEMPRLDQV